VAYFDLNPVTVAAVAQKESILGIAQEKLKIPKGTMEITFFDWATIPKYGNNHIRRQPAIQYAKAARMTHTSFTIDENKNLKTTIQDPDLRVQITPKNLHELTKWLKTARDNKYKRLLKSAFSNKDILREETLTARGELTVPSITERKFKQVNYRLAYLPSSLARPARRFLRPESTQRFVAEILQCQLGTLHTNLNKAVYYNNSQQHEDSTCNWCDNIETIGHILNPQRNCLKQQKPDTP
jgi:hypothetical protein